MENIKFVLAEILSPQQINAKTKKKKKINVVWVSEKTCTVGELEKEMSGANIIKKQKNIPPASFLPPPPLVTD